MSEWVSGCERTKVWLSASEVLSPTQSFYRNHSASIFAAFPPTTTCRNPHLSDVLSARTPNASAVELALLRAWPHVNVAS